MSNPLPNLYDSDILAIEKGPMAWMQTQQRSRRHLDDFVRGAKEKFAEIGFNANIKTYDTNEDGTFAFEVEILGRLENRAFDYDRQVHEVTNNILELPDQAGGVIKTDEAMLRVARNQKHKH